MQQARRTASSQEVEQEAPAAAPGPYESGRSQAEEAPVEAEFDTGGHQRIGDSVGGASVDVDGVAFTPGEFAALMDYVGSPAAMEEADFTTGQLLEMRQLVRDHCEDTLAWNRVTGGMYSELSQANDSHFAPGKGADHRESFISAYGAGYAAAQQALASEEGSETYETLMNEARINAYAAEHYLEDAFSAGHQIAAADVADSVDALLATDGPFFPHAAELAARVYAARPGVFLRYLFVPTMAPLSPPAFASLVEAAALLKGADGLSDGLRKYVHDRLGSVGVEVESEAHAPWVLTGDHGIDDNQTTIEALQAALSQARDTLELGVQPGARPFEVATDLFDHYAPRPTGRGADTIRNTLADATSSMDALFDALVESLTHTLPETLDTICSDYPFLLHRLVAPEPGGELPDLPPAEQPAVQTYRVAPGDTLSGIAQKVYGDWRKYEVIWHANEDQIEDPDLIEPEWVLDIPDGFERAEEGTASI